MSVSLHSSECSNKNMIGRPEQSVSMTEIDSLKQFLDRAQLSLKTVAIELMNL